MLVASTRHDTFFILYVCKHECARKIDNIKPVIQSSHVCARRVYDSLQMHVCMSEIHMPNLDCVHFVMHVCMQIVNQGQLYKLYKHCHVLRCDSPLDTRCKPQ